MANTGERKAQILQTLAAMLENPKGERITTALLAARLEVSEAALYRHFASKAQMYEGLIEFIEQTVFSLVKGIARDRAKIIVCAGNFHGRTTTIVGFSSEAQYRDGFGPFAPGFVSVPFGDAAALEAAITPHT